MSSNSNSVNLENFNFKFFLDHYLQEFRFVSQKTF